MGCGASAMARGGSSQGQEDVHFWIQECMTYVGNTREERFKESDIREIEAKENEFLVLPSNCPVAGVVEATYGTETHFVDVRAKVMAPLLLGEKVHVSNTELSVADPSPGQLKRLRVGVQPRQNFEYKVRSRSMDTERPTDAECNLELICPRLFNSVREVLKLDPKGYFQSIADLKGGGKQASGKSGASFFFSQDGRFVLKNVTDTETATLAGMLPDYIVHLKEHPESLLTRYLGAYRLTLPNGERLTLVAMNNVFEGASKIDVMFDLKGTTEDRWVDPAPGRCLKDNNFADKTIYLEEEMATQFHQAIDADSRFLEKRNIMDYSLMLAVVKSEDVQVTPGPMGTIHPSYSPLMGGVKGTKAEGVLAEGAVDCYVFFGIVDMLVTYGLKKVAANAIKSATIGFLTDEIDTVPPDRYGDRYRDRFRHKILGCEEQVTLRPVDGEVFQQPLQPMSRSGGTAAFFRVQYTDAACASEKQVQARESREYWIGKDLARSRDEVMFYEFAKTLRDKDQLDGQWDEWEHLRWMTAYGGICRIPCKVDDKSQKDLEIMLIRNCRDGYSTCRMLDVKIGVETAVAGLQGKSAFAAWRQSCLDRVTNSAGQGSRLEGFDNPPETLRSFQSLLQHVGTGLLASAKQLKRFHIQCMTAGQYLPLFLDLHASTPAGTLSRSSSLTAEQAPTLQADSLTAVETQELVLLDLIEQLAGFVKACRKVIVPQQWIGSSVMLCFDSGRMPLREVLARVAEEPGALGVSRWGVSRCQIFDWGRSELNTEPRHQRLTPEERATREKYWGYYCGGVAKLLYDCCALYVARFWAPPRSVSLNLLDKNALSDDCFFGAVVMPLKAADREKVSFSKLSGEPLTVGLLRPVLCDAEVSISERPLPADSRLQNAWTTTIHSMQILPGSAVRKTNDVVVETAGFPDDADTLKAAIFEQRTVDVPSLRHGSHCTTVARGRPAVWDESFELACLKPEAQDQFMKALEIALDRSLSQGEIESLFPESLAGANADRAEKQKVFAQMLFPKIQIDKQDVGNYGLGGFPQNDRLRMLHFGEWLAATDYAKDSLVFLLFFLAEKSRESALKYAKAFLRAKPGDSWASEVGGAVKQLEGASAQDAVVSRCRELLADVALLNLQEQWIAYDLQNQHEAFSQYMMKQQPEAHVERSSSPTYLASKSADPGLVIGQIRVIKQLQRVYQLKNQDDGSDLRGASPMPGWLSGEDEGPSPETGHSLLQGGGTCATFVMGGGVHAESSYSSASTAPDKIARAVPIIFTTLLSEEKATDTLRQACSSLSNDSAASGSTYAERCSYMVPEGGCKYAFSPGESCLSFEAIGQAMLDRIRREANGMEDKVLEQELSDPFCEIRNLSTNSKSGEVFLISDQGSFIIKTISDAEANGFMEFLPRYQEHFLRSPRSVLGRYVGFFRIDLGPSCGGLRYVTVMQSVFKCPHPVSVMYDIKGSTHNRSSKPGESVKKDNDWVADGIRLDLSQQEADLLKERHIEDTQLLSSNNVMDFSLLVGLVDIGDADLRVKADPPPPGCWIGKDQSKLYLLGIVDFLVDFGFRKRAEAALHEIRGKGDSASVTDPASYASRQQAFVQGSMLPQGHLDSPSHLM